MMQSTDYYSEQAVNTKQELQEKMAQMIGLAVPVTTPEQVTAAVNAAAAVYLEGKEGGQLNKGIADFFGDIFLTYPSIASAKLLKDHVKNTYLYNYAYKRSKSALPSYMTSDHGDDIMTMFGFSEFVDLNPWIEDKEMFDDVDSKF